MRDLLDVPLDVNSYLSYYYNTLFRKEPRAIIICESRDLKILMNFSFSFRWSKFGIISLTVLYRVRLCDSCVLHFIKQCCSSSTSPEVHLSQILSSAGTTGRSCLPVSIFKLCELHLNLAIFVYIFLFKLRVRYGSNLKSVLKSLYVLSLGF